jgi:hypothetical protein
MTYAGTHRGVGFSVQPVNGAWKYTINNECFGQYHTREHAITAAIQHIDRMLLNHLSRGAGE